MAYKSIITETKGEAFFLRGKAKWAHVQEPDAYGNFSVNIYPDTEELIRITDKSKDIRDRAAKEVQAAGKQVVGVAPVFKTDENTVEYIQCKLPYEGYDNKNNKIDFIGLDGTKLENFTELVGNDSEVVVKIYIKPYYMNSTKMVGVSNKFYAMQIINLVKYSSNKSEEGFGNFTDNTVKVNEETGFTNIVEDKVEETKEIPEIPEEIFEAPKSEMPF